MTDSIPVARLTSQWVLLEMCVADYAINLTGSDWLRSLIHHTRWYPKMHFFCQRKRLERNPILLDQLPWHFSQVAVTQIERIARKPDGLHVCHLPFRPQNIQNVMENNCITCLGVLWNMRNTFDLHKLLQIRLFSLKRSRRKSQIICSRALGVWYDAHGVIPASIIAIGSKISQQFWTICFASALLRRALRFFKGSNRAISWVASFRVQCIMYILLLKEMVMVSAE